MEIDSVEALESVVGKKPPALDLKVVDHIDPSSQKWLSYSRAMIACVGTSLGPRMIVAGGQAGFAQGANARLTIPLESFDDISDLVIGAPFGSLWLVPGMRETLRLNGTIVSIEAGALAIEIRECYLHCAKAFIRSDFWAARPNKDAPADEAEFLAQSRFLALGTINSAGEADLSPKGDPAGRLVQSHGDALVFADRPGNRRTDSFRNILTQSAMAAALIAPGVSETLLIHGTAVLQSDETKCAGFAVQDRAPKLVVEVRDLTLDRRASRALERAQLWSDAPPEPPSDLEPAKIFAAHMRLSKEKSLSARIAKAAVSVPGLMQRGLDKDYDTNLY